MLKIFIVLTLLLAATAAVFPQSAATDETALKSLIRKLTDAQLAFDAATLDKIFTHDYIEISPLGELDTRERVLGFYSPSEKAKMGSMAGSVDVADYSIRIFGKFAVVIARLNYKMSSEGKPLPPRSIRAMFVCQKEKAAWRIVSAQYTGIRSPTSQPRN